MMAVPVITLSAAWFEFDREGCRLLAATADPDMPLSFGVPMRRALPPWFLHAADFKGQRVFEATWPHKRRGVHPFDGAPLLRLEGPFRNSAA